MGVPAFFRWLSKKYPSIVVQCDDGVKGQYHFDNLYLDMNGIIHPCSHPEHKAPPETEEEMFEAIFEYIENIMTIVKPKKLLYMAIDGVAPRAKMNQQRSRRFRASQESFEKIAEVAKVKEELRNRGIQVKDKPKEAHFDSNVITPGTQFMMNLSEALMNWINLKLGNEQIDKNGIWPKDLVVILSDAFVPGEGEHKIMDYIRKQKAKPTYNPNLSHCLYGADADLIMLGLATHELNFTILREEFKANQPKPCEICGQLGHEMTDCLGTEREKDDMDIILPQEPEFIYIRLNVLREHLERECNLTIDIKLDLERFVDDFVFLCFFVGNDFLPHLPSLEIREGAIDRLLNIYKEIIVKNKDASFHLTDNGLVNLGRVQQVLLELGKVEDEIFKSRQENEMRWKERTKRMKKQNEQHNFDSAWLRPEAVVAGQRPKKFDNTRLEAYKTRVSNQDNLSAAQKLKASLRGDQEENQEENQEETSLEGIKASKKRKFEEPEEPEEVEEAEEDDDPDPDDMVQLWNDGWKERYYQHKFDCSGNFKISDIVAKEYIIGLCWVLRYYYQGCADWKWFYPFHYAPFASDFVNIADMKISFDRDAQPFYPLEQLMSVFPAASSQNLPLTWRKLMCDPNSPIIDFYPDTFKIDLNGKKAAWMGVALLPFIDERRLFDTLNKVYPDLTEEEKQRNARGTHLIFFSKQNQVYSNFAKEIIESEQTVQVEMDPDIFGGISGMLMKSEKYSIFYDKVYCLIYIDPQYDKDFIFPAKRLENAVKPPKVLRPEDYNPDYQGAWRPTIGMNQSQQRASFSDAGKRMLSHSLPNDTYNKGQGTRQQPWHTKNSNPNYQANYQSNYQPNYQSNQQQYRPFYGIPQSYNQQSNNNNNNNNNNRQPQSSRTNYSQSFDPWQKKSY